MTRTAAPTAATTSVPPRRMRDRVPAQGPIEQLLMARAALRPRTALERLVGVDPIAAERLPDYTGVLAERAVAGRLAALPDGWTVFHSLPTGRNGARVDHLVVGPGGVFTFDTRQHRDAAVWIAGHAVLVAGRRQAHLQRAETQARRVDRVVGAVVPEAPAVHPVVAVAGAKRLAPRAQSGPVQVLRADQVVRFLLTRPAVLAPEQVAALVARFDDARTWRPTTDATPELLLAFADLGRELRGAARRRAVWLSSLLALTATGAAMLALPALGIG